MAHVTVLANTNERDTGLVGDVLAGLGFMVSEVSRDEPSGWSIRETTDLFMHLGSSWSTYWESVRNSVSAETELMRQAVARGVPVLGICFGAQLLSHAFGGVVQRGRKAEIGWHDVVATSDGEHVGGRWMQWHYDSFTAPNGFDVLAINDAGIQAIRRGRSLGVQFHPEANEAIVASWMSGAGAVELAEAGIPPHELLEETQREVARTRNATKGLTEWFLEVVAQGPYVDVPGN